MTDSAEAGPPPTEAVPPVRLEVFSDYTCPWCYIGWARLEKALAALPEGITVDVDWRPFEIHPEVPPEGMPVTDLHYPPDQWARMQEALKQNAADEGLDVGKRPKVANTHRALLAGAYAQAEEPGRFAAFHEALFVGYFAEGQDLGDPEVVDGLARRAGIDTDAMNAALAAGRYEPALAATSERARSLGITGTPTFLFEGRYVAAGAIPTESLKEAFARIVEMRDGSPATRAPGSPARSPRPTAATTPRR